MTPLTDAEYERIMDRRVMQRLAADPRYRNAEDEKAQKRAEDEIEREVIRELDAKYGKRIDSYTRQVLPE